jgi:hypothetical protein
MYVIGKYIAKRDFNIRNCVLVWSCSLREHCLFPCAMDVVRRMPRLMIDFGSVVGLGCLVNKGCDLDNPESQCWFNIIEGPLKGELVMCRMKNIDVKWSLQLREATRQCANCGIEQSRANPLLPKFAMCFECKHVHYCSRHCQKIHWKSEHKHQCPVYKASAVASLNRSKKDAKTKMEMNHDGSVSFSERLVVDKRPIDFTATMLHR